MKHTYIVSGMTCSSCQSKVQHLLSQVKGVNNVSIDLEKGEAEITMEHHISTLEFKTVMEMVVLIIESSKNKEEALEKIARLENND